MSNSTSIEWTDVTDNIITVKGGGWWCRKISPGCANCYAARLNQSSYFGGNKLAYSGEAPELELKLELMASWARMNKPKKHFVASMTDIFGEWVKREWQWQMLDAMLAAPKQTFQLLTKRPDVMENAVNSWLCQRGQKQAPDNMLFGCTVENQEEGDRRIPHLLKIPGKRFLSCEPLLEKTNIRGYLMDFVSKDPGKCGNCGRGHGFDRCPNYGGISKSDKEWGCDNFKRIDFAIHWVICGGESGPGARPMHPDWARSLRDQCAEAGVPFFFKQWGEFAPILENVVGTSAKPPRFARMDCGKSFILMERIGKAKAGRLLDRKEHNGFPI